MIQANGISLSFGTQTIFRDLSFTVQQEKIGIVGRNGAGKSTLLKALAGLIPVDEGSLAIGKGCSLGYLPQEMLFNSSERVIDEALGVFAQQMAALKKRQHLEELLAKNPSTADLEQYAEVCHILQAFDIQQAQREAARILQGVGFSQEQYQKAVNQLSTGWKMRLVLAKLLLQKPTFYLFDEPTNHLDIVAKGWFCDFLRTTSSGFFLVSHDRYFLDTVCDRIFELERGVATMYTGNFTEYVTQKEHARAATEVAYKRQQKDIARKEATIERFRASASKSRMAQSMIKQLEKIERITVDPPLPTITCTIPGVPRAGAIVLSIAKASYAHTAHTLFKDINLEIGRGQKIALLGANGIGKTTLLQLITGKRAPQQGTITFGHNVTWALFEQDQEHALPLEKTIFEAVIDAAPQQTEATLRSMLGAFLFSGDDIHKKIRVLSGGERNRVAMVMLLAQQANFLILDEPTNHLDMYAKEILLQALTRYTGTLLFVSHDQDFINRLATSIAALTPQGIERYDGSYQDYCWLQEQRKSVPEFVTRESTPQEIKKALPQAHSKNSYTARKEIRSTEQRIERLEHEITALSLKIGSLAYGSSPYTETLAQLTQKQEELAQQVARWELLAKQV